MDNLSDVDDTGRPRILPGLLDLQIECPFIAPGALVEVLEARRANGHGLERLMPAAAVVEDDSKWTDDVKARLRSLVSSFEIFI